MELVELISEEWISSLSGVYTDEEANFMSQLLGSSNCPLPEQLHQDSKLGNTAFWSGGHESTVTKNNFDAKVPNTDFVCFLQGNTSSTYGSNNMLPTISGLNHTSNNTITKFVNISMDVSLGDSKFNPYLVQENDSKHITENTDEELGLDTGKVVLADQNFLAQKELGKSVSEPQEYKVEKSGKRSRSSNEVQKNKRKAKSKKNNKSVTSTEEDMSPGSQDHTTRNFSSEDDSQEQCRGASSSLSNNDSTALSLKSRSSRGTATDPQSIYARKRRERINERLKILQNLVPNGTKVDISTMLEEAVQYVKLLQLQIKLLSSDELWMYAPMAYNGMKVGLQLSITPTKEPNDMHIKENAAV